MSERPQLSRDLAATIFAEHYWLRAELAEFCRNNNISAAGSKQDLAARIAALLSGEPQPPVARKSSHGKMPARFTRAAPIGPGWRCSEALRAFISGEIGRPFRFDRFMRAQIGSGSGAALGDVIDAWREQEGRSHEIEPQFEYNRFTREYRAHVPNATHASVVAAWKRYREIPVSQRPPVQEFARS